jgi:hypothetical protein
MHRLPAARRGSEMAPVLSVGGELRRLVLVQATTAIVSRTTDPLTQADTSAHRIRASSFPGQGKPSAGTQ